MKKVLAIILAIVMLMALSACNIKDVTRMASAGDVAVEKGVFNFYLQNIISNTLYTAQNSGSELSAESSEKDWKEIKIGDKTARETVIENVKEKIRELVVMKAIALKEGMNLTAEDQETIKTQRTSIIEQYGGRYNYEQIFTAGGFTLEDVTKAIELELYDQKVSAKYFNQEDTDEGMAELSEEVLKKYNDEYVSAKHILIKNYATASAGAELEKSEEDYNKEAKAKAEDIIKQIAGGADFDKLMLENSEDTGAEGEVNGAEGYVFTKGYMVKPFEEAAYALETGKYTETPVETDFGWHIIKRQELPESGDEYDAAIEQIKSDILKGEMDAQISAWAEEIGFKFNEKAINNIKIVK